MRPRAISLPERGLQEGGTQMLYNPLPKNGEESPMSDSDWFILYWIGVVVACVLLWIPYFTQVG